MPACKILFMSLLYLRFRWVLFGIGQKLHDVAKTQQ